MKLKTDSWHYRLWIGSFGLYEMKPQSTDLCRYCHRVFWQMMTYGFVGLAITGIVAGLGYGVFYKGLYQHTAITLELIAITLTVVGAIVLYVRWLHGKGDAPQTLAGQWVQARKEKVCPIIEFGEGDES